MGTRIWRVSCLAVLVVCAAGARLPASDTARQDDTGPPTIGLAVEPGGLLIQGIGPGELYDLEQETGILLTIRNRDRTDHTYLLSTHRPSEVGNRRLPVGYSDVVDPSWLSFEQREVRVPAQGSSRVRMYLEIPDDERYRNQHWSVSVAIVGKAERGETLTLALYPRYEIETASAPREELRLRPAGQIGLCPSIAGFDLLPGSTQTREVVICNNDRKRHSYRISLLGQGDLGDGRRIFPSGGYNWIPDVHWIGLPRPRLRPSTTHSARNWPVLWLARRSYVGCPVTVTLPEGVPLPERGWEAILFVERDDGDTGFARVRVTRETST